MIRILLALCLMGGAAWAQPFQTVLTAPATDSYEAALAFPPSGVAAGQTNSFALAGAGNRVLLTRYNATGGFAWNRVYPMLPGQLVSYQAIDIKPVAASVGLPAGFYVVGNVRKPNGPVATAPGIFVTRLTNMGVVLWHREFIPSPNQQTAVSAVSVEVMNDNGPILVANVTNTGNGSQAIMSARFTPFGATIWSQRYQLPGCQGQLSSIQARESAKDVTGAQSVTAVLCTGQTIISPQLPEAIVVTGDFRPCDPNFVGVYGGNRRSFALKINERGLEVWRFAYPSLPNTTGSDTGFDLVQLPNRNFVVAGRTDQLLANGSPLTSLYAFEITPLGALVCGAIHASPDRYNTYARGITLSHKQGNVVVTGPLDSLGRNRIMVTELTPTCSPFLWANMYPKASPANVAEGIDRVVSNPGRYFVTANALTNNNVDAFAMLTDLTGKVPSCPVIPIKFERFQATKPERLPNCQQSFGDWLNVNVNSVPVQPAPKICINLGPNPANAREAAVLEDIQITLFPNPSAQSVLIDFLNEHTDGTVVIADLMGNPVTSVPFRSADKQVSVNTQGLRSGLYTVRVQQSNGVVRSARLLKEL